MMAAPEASVQPYQSRLSYTFTIYPKNEVIHRYGTCHNKVLIWCMYIRPFPFQRYVCIHTRTCGKPVPVDIVSTPEGKVRLFS